MTRRHRPHSRVVTAFTKLPEPLADGRVRCICGRVVRLTTRSRLRAHTMPNGDPCAHTATYQSPPKLTEIPDVKIRTAGAGHGIAADPDQPRLLAGSHCIDCHRWLPGERNLCGQCGRRREQERYR